MLCWSALASSVSADGGALEFIAGSHRWNRWFQPFLAGDDGAAAGVYEASAADYEPLPDFDAERDQHSILSWEMKPGDAVAFHLLGCWLRHRRR